MGNKQTSLSPKTMKQLREVLSDEYTNEDIKEWYEEYQKSLKRGETSLTMENFIRMYNRTFEGEASNFAEQVFRVFDTDGNGFVDFKEFMLGIYVTGSDLGDDLKLDWAFKMYDQNGDGYITRDEMEYMLSSIRRMTLTPDLDPVKLTDDFFERFDEDHDNRISNKEFVERARENRDIIHMLEVDPCPDE